MSDRRLSFLFLLPIVLCIVLFVIWPVVQVIVFSFTNQVIYSADRSFIGWSNYRNAIQDPEVWSSLFNSLVWTFGSITLQLIVGLLVALLLNRSFPGRGIFRSIVLFSYLIPVVVAALVWRYMLSESTGIINYVIREWLQVAAPAWFSSRLAMLSVILMNTWKNFPFIVIVLLAQLQTIDPQLYEAARIDGAHRFQEFRFITLPSILPVVLVALMLRSIFTFKNYDMIGLFTGGGPLNYTTTLPVEIYDTTFKEFYLGKGSALSTIMFVIIVGISLAYIRAYRAANRKLS